MLINSSKVITIRNSELTSSLWNKQYNTYDHELAIAISKLIDFLFDFCLFVYLLLFFFNLFISVIETFNGHLNILQCLKRIMTIEVNFCTLQ